MRRQKYVSEREISKQFLFESVNDFNVDTDPESEEQLQQKGVVGDFLRDAAGEIIGHFIPYRTVISVVSSLLMLF